MNNIFSKNLLFVVGASMLLLTACKFEESPSSDEQLTPYAKKEKSYHESYMEEIAEISPRKDSSTNSGMLKIKGGEFLMGGNSAQARKDEFPQHFENVKDLWVDETEVTNTQFIRFTIETGYVTTAERSFEIDGEKYLPGALVFNPDNRNVWWKFVEDSSWKHPYGPNSTIQGKDSHPVVQASWYDAMAYAKWAGKRLPTEAEFEYLIRSGKKDEIYPWGNDFKEATVNTNFHQGKFPGSNELEDQFEKTAPVKSFPPNKFGLYDMTGNVWEWCLDTYHPDAYSIKDQKEDDYFKQYHNPEQQKVIRGGSFLCNESYCTGYRNAARMSSSPDSSLEHTGFRCVKDT